MQYRTRATRVFIALLLINWQLHCIGADNFDEIYDKNGNVRPHYEVVEKIWRSLSKQRLREIRQRSTRAFMGDNSLSPLPRLYTQAEADFIKLGVAQRGTALSLFLRDHYSGKKRYLKAGIIPRFVIERIIARTGVKGYEGRVNPKKIPFPNFLYGPDVFRDSKGVFRVFEDNEGFLGGMGDLETARETLLQLIPEYKEALKIQDQPSQFYDQLADYMKARAKKNGGIPLLVSLPMTQQADKEEVRLRRLMKTRGIDFVSTGTARTLVRTSEGLFLRYPYGEMVKVGYVFLAAEHHDVDSSNPEAFKKNLIEYAHEHIAYYELMLRPNSEGLKGEDLKLWHWGQTIPLKRRHRMIARLKHGLEVDPKNGEPNWDLLELIMTNESQIRLDITEDRRFMFKRLTDAILDGVVESSFSPGLEIIDDKEFYSYVEDLIRFYLKQEPLLLNVEGGSFYTQRKNGKISLNSRLLSRIASNRSEYVIKGVNGRGGDAVWIGARMTKAAFEKVLKKVKKNYRDYKWEKYTPPSVHGHDIGDIRWLSFFGARSFIISPTGWLRGADKNGSGKVNISERGHEVAAVVVPSLTKGCYLLPTTPAKLQGLLKN